MRADAVKKPTVIRALAALAATLVVVWLAVPHGGARDSAAPTVMQPDAAPSVIAEGPPGRVALNGPWTLRSDAVSRGQLRGWTRGGFAGSDVRVPNATNGARVEGLAGIRSFRGTIGWYSTSFTVGRDGTYAIHFESVNHRARVWLDGREIGQHKGVYLPFEFPVALKAGVEHTLVVRADYRHPMAMKADGWHRTWFNFGGINREVSVRPLGPSELDAPTVRTRLQPDGSARVDVGVHVLNRGPTTRTLAPQGVLSSGGSHSRFAFPSVSIPPGQTRVLRAFVVVKRPRLWSPGAPNLYELDLGIPGETTYTLRTGLRELGHRGRELLLNGRRIELHGASLQEDAQGTGDALTTAQMDRIVADLKSIGANATRAQHPLNPALLERLDAAGIMVWQGIGPVDAPGAWTSKTPALRAQAKARVRQTLYQAQTHPSIIAWNLANEVAGNGHPGGQASYIDQMARELKRRDPGRLVALDVWGAHPPKVAGPMYDDVDAVGDTNYIGWYSDLEGSRAHRRAAIRAHVAQFMRTFPGKVVAVTEFGAEANGRNATDSPGGYRWQQDFLRDHIDVYRSIPGLSGMLVWNLRDFAVSPAFAGGSIRTQVPQIKLVRGINQKGIYAYDNRPKPAVQTVRQLYAQIAHR